MYKQLRFAHLLASLSFSMYGKIGGIISQHSRAIYWVILSVFPKVVACFCTACTITSSPTLTKLLINYLALSLPKWEVSFHGILDIVVYTSSSFEDTPRERYDDMGLSYILCC